MADNKSITATFAEIAPRYREIMDRQLQDIWGINYDEFIRRLIEKMTFSDGDVILDVATGTASIPLAIVNRAETKTKVVGMDVTEVMLKCGLLDVQAEARTHIDLVCASAMLMPFAGTAFNLVICGFGMHYLNIPRALSEMNRVLKYGGSIIIATAGVSPFWRWLWEHTLIRKLAFFYFGLTHDKARVQSEVHAISNIHTAEEWRGILFDSGFSDIDITIDFARRRFWYPDGLVIKAAKRLL